MANDTSLFNKFGRTIKPGEIVFKEGDSGNEMFIIQNGKVRISKVIGNREHVLAVLVKGDFFGEMAIVNNVKRTATATAASHVNLLCFNREGFINMINKNAKIAVNIIDKLCRRLQNMNMQIQHILKKNVKGIIELNLFYSFKELTGADKRLDYEPTVESIALNLGVPLQQVERNIKDLEIKEIIKITDKYINLMDGEKFIKIIEGNVF
jgi:CRP/FNR family transcriptional regulator, cyclic AMP receptor protein